MMRGMNGYQLYQRVRQNPEWLWIPFIFLTAKAEVEDIRFGKELGVDDYLTKPVDPENLIATVRGRLARYDQLRKVSVSSPEERPSGRYEIGKLLVDLSRRQVFISGTEVRLSQTEFEILQRMILARGAVVPHGELLGHDDSDVLGQKDAAERLRYHIRSIRQKIREEGGEEDLIVNVRSMGYRLAEEPSYLV